MLSFCRFALPAVSLLVAGCAAAHRDAATTQAPGPAAASSSASDAEVAELAEALDRLVAAEMPAQHVPGLAVVVVRGGQTILKRGYGSADLEAGRAVDPDTTLFRIGSITKALTAMAVTRTTHDGRLDMNADVSRFVRGITNTSGSDRPVTVRDLISHSSGFDQIGLDRHIRDFERPLAERKAMRPSLRRYLEAGNLRRVTPPGQLFRYDTYGIVLAGVILEQVTGRPYDQAMRQELFQPLGMRNSFVEADDEHLPRLAKGYGFVDGAYVPQPYEVYVTTPASSIDATPADMGRLLEALTSDGSNGHGRLFPADRVAEVLGPQFRPQPQCPGATHGFFEGAFGSTPAAGAPRTVGHSGSMLGFSNLLTIAPEAKVGIFVVANRDAEAGGGGVPLLKAITELALQRLAASDAQPGLSLQTSSAAGDYAPYAGTYHFGAYCRTCSAAERERGAWAPGEPRMVAFVPGGLRIGTEAYRATTTANVFLREDGGRHVCFGKDMEGRVSHFTYSGSPNTFERAADANGR